MSTTVSTNLVSAVAATWAGIRRRHHDVPDVVIALGSGAGRRGMVLGHFAAGVWDRGGQDLSELFLGAEGLREGARGVLVTLLHEGGHGMAATRGIKDTSRQGRYHNERYRGLAVEIGLDVTRHDQLGWSPSSLPEATAADYGDELGELSGALVAYRRTYGPAGGRGGSNNGVAAKCGCNRRIRVSRTAYDQGPIVCGVCGVTFACADDRLVLVGELT